MHRMHTSETNIQVQMNVKSLWIDLLKYQKCLLNTNANMSYM
jgi:hypothetical protein